MTVSPEPSFPNSFIPRGDFAGSDSGTVNPSSFSFLPVGYPYTPIPGKWAAPQTAKDRVISGHFPAVWYNKRKTGRRPRMDKKHFSRIRRRLRKSQSEMAQLLTVSLRAVQSFEQGWRNIPAHVERQMLFLVAKEKLGNRESAPCWVILDCPTETRRNCPAWMFHSGELCWFINGKISQGKVQKSWRKKMEMCQQCKAFQRILSTI